MVSNQFLSILNKSGLKTVQAKGEIFDPQYHEAVNQELAEDKKDQEIIKEYQKGYILNGRLLRPAKVAVAKNPSSYLTVAFPS